MNPPRVSVSGEEQGEFREPKEGFLGNILGTKTPSSAL